MISNILQAAVSLKRIGIFLDEEETAKYQIVDFAPADGSGAPTIGFENATFSYASADDAHGTNEVFDLRDLDFVFPSAGLSLVVGKGASSSWLQPASLLMGFRNDSRKCTIRDSSRPRVPADCASANRARRPSSYPCLARPTVSPARHCCRPQSDGKSESIRESV